VRTGDCRVVLAERDVISSSGLGGIAGCLHAQMGASNSPIGAVLRMVTVLVGQAVPGADGVIVTPRRHEILGTVAATDQGMLMEREGIGVLDALAMLRRSSLRAAMTVRDRAENMGAAAGPGHPLRGLETDVLDG